jgi:hypothetical protein
MTLVSPPGADPHFEHEPALRPACASCGQRKLPHGSLAVKRGRPSPQPILVHGTLSRRALGGAMDESALSDRLN